LASIARGGISEIIDNKTNGILVKDGDIQAFSNRIEQYSGQVQKPELIPQSVEKFSKATIITQYESLFNKLT